MIVWLDGFDVPKDHESLFCFEGSDWRWDPRCLDAEEAHFRRIRASIASHSWTWGGVGGDSDSSAYELLRRAVGLGCAAESKDRSKHLSLPSPVRESHECHCHLTWPLEKFRFHGGHVPLTTPLMVGKSPLGPRMMMR